MLIGILIFVILLCTLSFKLIYNDKHNVLTIRTKKNSIEVALNAKLGTINLDNIDFVYDISNRMWTASQYAFKFDNETNIDIVKGIINQIYNVVK